MGGLQPGDPNLIGPYRLVRELGSGGMGRVFLGYSPGGRPVAVKVIRAELAADPEFRVRFTREVTAARKVSGFFTALVVDADVEAPVMWLATAYIAGPSLADVVAGHGPLPAGSVLALAAGLAEGLGAIHSAGLVHRDLKPSNVLLAEDGPRVIDFGISRAVEATSLTSSGFVVGSPGFMSPEQAEGREVGPPSDIFSLGAVLAFAATGQGPFGAGSTAALVYRVVHGSPNLDRLPAEVRPMIERCLAKDAGQRPTPADLLAQVGTVQPAPGWLPEPISRELALNSAAATAPASDLAGNASAVQVPTENSQVPADVDAEAAGPSTVTGRKPSAPPMVPSAQPQLSGSDRNRPRSRRRLVAAAVLGGLAVAAVVSIILATTTRHGPPAPSGASSGAAQPPNRLVSITLSPTTSAGTNTLMAAARVLRQRAAHLHLSYTQAQVSGQNVVLTGPAVDEAQLKALAIAGVLNFRQVLLYQPYTSGTTTVPGPSASSGAPAASPSASAPSSTSTAAGSTAFGNASLVNHNTLALFDLLTCKPGDTTQWKSQVGYTTAEAFNNPDMQIVSCDSSGDKYALNVAKVTGTQISSVTAELSRTSNQWEVLLKLNGAGTIAFANLTSQQASKYYADASTNEDDFWLDTIAVVLDGTVVTAPETNSAIPGGQAQITGNFTQVRAEELAAQLQSGALPVDLRVGTISTFSSSGVSNTPS